MGNLKLLRKSSLKPYAQKLRREMTPEERKLWHSYLKLLPCTVNRQKVIGPIIVDFFCSEAKLVIEVDGRQHLTEEGIETDCQRDEYLLSRGFKVMRIPNERIRNDFTGVCREIGDAVEIPFISQEAFV